jgi:hypothetical protein
MNEILSTPSLSLARRDALLRTGIYGTEDEVILEIQRHMWQVSKEISEIGVPWRDHEYN